MRWIRLIAGLTVALVACAPILSAAVPERRYTEIRSMVAEARLPEAVEALRAFIPEHPTFDRAYLLLVLVRWRMNQLDVAGRDIEELVAARPAGPYALYARGVYYKVRREYARAEELFRRCIDAAPRYFPAYSDLVESAHWGGRSAEAEKFFRERVATAPGTPGPLYGLGYVFRLREEWTNAEHWYREAEPLASGEWEILNGRYEVTYRTARFEEALAALREMLGKLEGKGDLEREGITLGRMGMIYADLGEYEKSAAALRTSVDFARRVRDRPNEQVFQANLGHAYFNLARYDEALAEYQGAIKLARELGRAKERGRTLGLTGLVYMELAEYAKAIDAFQQAIRVARETKDRPSEADQMASLSLVYSALGDEERALEQARGALAISTELKNPWLEGRFHQILGTALWDQGQLQEALESYQQGLALARKVGDKAGEAIRVLRASEVQALLGNPIAARQGFTTALALARETGARPVECQALVSQAAMLLRLKNLEEAQKLYRQGLAIANEIGLSEVAWRAHAGLGAVQEAKAEPATSREEYRRAINVIETVRTRLATPEDRAGFLSERLDVYRRMVRLLVAQHAAAQDGGYEEQAFHYAERARARAFLDSLTEPRLTPGDSDRSLAIRQRDIEGRLSQLQSRLLRLHSQTKMDRGRIRELQAELKQANDEYISLEREIRTRLPGYAAFRYPEPLGLEQTRAVLDSGSALLAYSVGDKESFLFAVSRDGHRVIRLPAARALGLRVQRLRRSIAAGPTRANLLNYITEATALYRELIRPAAALLDGKDELIIVPDGVLHLLPFGALLRNMPQAGTPVSELSYTVRRWSIRYAPSASVLATLGSRRPSVAPALAFAGFGDPSYETSGEANRAGPDAARGLATGSSRIRFRRLPYSRQEVEAIARLYPPGQTRVYLGSEATEENAKTRAGLGQFRFIHFAAHGLIDERRPQFSSLALSSSTDPGGAEDGLLQAYEIVKLKLNSELVVLSACETNLGKHVEGEGLVGLTQAFLYAGARSVVATLWNVADHSSSELMTAFHRQLRITGRAEALRRAQLQLIAKGSFAHPYFWAAFSLIGASR